MEYQFSYCAHEQRGRAYPNSLEWLHREALQPGQCRFELRFPGWTMDVGATSLGDAAWAAGGGARALPTLPSPLNVWVGTIERRWPVWGQWTRHYGNCVAINFTWVGPATPVVLELLKKSDMVISGCSSARCTAG